MIYCQKCRKPLNEFDVEFTQKMYRTKDFRKCNCFKCSVGQQNYDIFLKMQKTIRNIKIVCVWLGLILLSSICTIIVTGRFDYETIAIIGIYSSCVAGYFVVISFDFKETEGYYTGNTIVTLEKSGENSWIKKEEAEYVSGGSDGFFARILFVVFSALVLIPYIIYAATKYILFPNCPTELKTTFHEVQKEKSYRSLGKSAGRLYKAQGDYRKSTDKIRAKYHYLDERSLKLKTNDVMYPMCVVSVVPKEQRVSRYWMFQTRSDLAFILFKNKDGTFEGMIHEIEGYPIHLTDYWEEEFKLFGINREMVDAAMRGVEQREQIINSSGVLSRFI